MFCSIFNYSLHRRTFIPQVHIKEFTLSSNCENQGFFSVMGKNKFIFFKKKFFVSNKYKKIFTEDDICSNMEIGF